MSQTEVQLIKDLAVVTGDIADQAVTLDKLPHGTGSNDGKFLRANNGADPSFESVDTSTIPITNEGSDTTCFPIFATAATGTLALKSNSALTFNSNTGALSATVLGGAATNITGIPGKLTGEDLSGLGNVGIDATLTARKINVTDDGSTSPLVSIMADDGTPWAFQIGNATAANNTGYGIMNYVNNTGAAFSLIAGLGAYKEWTYQTNNGSTTNTMMKFNSDRSLSLYHQNGTRLQTTSYGISVGGSAGAISAAAGIEISNSATSEIRIKNTSSGSANTDGFAIQKWSNGIVYLYDYDDFDIVIGTGNTSRWVFTGANGHFEPITNDNVNIGSASKRVKNIFTMDLSLSNKGSQNSVDSTWGDYTIQEGHEDLFLINNRTGKKFKFNLTEVG
tara:strand:+ start:657 stop:1832 length:1176 start_codon:yes stop_codon:yes gene_type:complete